MSTALSTDGAALIVVHLWIPLAQRQEGSGTGKGVIGTYNIVVGDRGRIVVPAEIRERSGFDAGTRLVLLDTPHGLVLLSREQLRARVRDELEGAELVGELLAERRRAAELEDAR